MPTVVALITPNIVIDEIKLYRRAKRIGKCQHHIIIAIRLAIKPTKKRI